MQDRMLTNRQTSSPIYEVILKGSADDLSKLLNESKVDPNDRLQINLKRYFNLGNQFHDDLFIITPLQLAIYLNDPIKAEILLRKGARLCTMEEDGVLVLTAQQRHELNLSDDHHYLNCHHDLCLCPLLEHEFLKNAVHFDCTDTIKFLANPDNITKLTRPWSSATKDITFKGTGFPSIEPNAMLNYDNVINYAIASNKPQIIEIIMHPERTLLGSLFMSFKKDGTTVREFLPWKALLNNANQIVHVFKKFGCTEKLTLLSCAPWIQDNESWNIVFNEIKSINDSDAYGNTPIHYAAFANNIQGIEFLAKQGANVFAVNKHGITIFDYAALTGNFELLTHLMQTYFSADTFSRYGAITQITTSLQDRFYTLLYSVTPSYKLSAEYNIHNQNEPWAMQAMPRYEQFNRHFNSIIDILNDHLHALISQRPLAEKDIEKFINNLTDIRTSRISDNPILNEKLRLLIQYLLNVIEPEKRQHFLMKTIYPNFIQHREFDIKMLRAALAWAEPSGQSAILASLTVKVWKDLQGFSCTTQFTLHSPFTVSRLLIKTAEVDREILDTKGCKIQTPLDIDKAVKLLIPLLLINRNQKLYYNQIRLPDDAFKHITTFITGEIQYAKPEGGIFSVVPQSVPNLFKPLCTRAASLLKSQPASNQRMLEEKKEVIKKHYDIFCEEFFEFLFNKPILTDRNFAKSSFANYTFEFKEIAQKVLDYKTQHATVINELLKKSKETKEGSLTTKTIQHLRFNLEQSIIQKLLSNPAILKKSYALSDMNAKRGDYTCLASSLVNNINELRFLKNYSIYLSPSAREGYYRELFCLPYPKKENSAQPSKRPRY